MKSSIVDFVHFSSAAKTLIHAREAGHSNSVSQSLNSILRYS